MALLTRHIGTFEAGHLDANESTAPFFIEGPGHQVDGGFLPLECTIAGVGTFATGDIDLEALIGSEWHTVPSAQLTSGTEILVIGPELAPSAKQFRFTMSGATGGETVRVILNGPHAYKFFADLADATDQKQSPNPEPAPTKSRSRVSGPEG